MRKLAVIPVAAIAATLALVAPAAQARTAWMSTPAHVESILINHWSSPAGVPIVDAGCWGNWTGAVSGRPHHWWFNKLGCNVWDANGHKHQVRVIVAGPGRSLRVTEINRY
jgi:hypothetical protein